MWSTLKTVLSFGAGLVELEIGSSSDLNCKLVDGTKRIEKQEATGISVESSTIRICIFSQCMTSKRRRSLVASLEIVKRFVSEGTVKGMDKALTSPSVEYTLKVPT